MSKTDQHLCEASHNRNYFGEESLREQGYMTEFVRAPHGRLCKGCAQKHSCQGGTLSYWDAEDAAK